MNDTIMELGSFSILWGMTEDKYFARRCTRRDIEEMDFGLFLGLYESCKAIRQAYLEYCGELNKYNRTPVERLRPDSHWKGKVHKWLTEQQ